MNRISITIPEDLLTAADERARSLDRSRSWVLADALRHYLAQPAPALAVHEPSAPRYGSAPPGATGLGQYRQAQLEADLSLSPEERVKEAERTLRLSERGARPRQNRIMMFDRFEDYLEWDRHEVLR